MGPLGSGEPAAHHSWWRIITTGHGDRRTGRGAYDQRRTLTYLGVQLFDTGFGLSLVLFAGFCALVGVLILRSRLVPRLLGALMVAAGASYLTNTLALILSPRLSDSIFPMILLPSLVGELSLALWLPIKGVKVATPTARLGASIPAR